MKWQGSGKEFKETSNEVELRINRVQINSARPVDESIHQTNNKVWSNTLNKHTKIGLFIVTLDVTL